MKTKLVLTLATVILFISGCSINIRRDADGIEPSQRKVEVQYPQSQFDKLDIRVVGDIQLIQSDKSHIMLSAPENYIGLFKFENDDGELKVKYAHKNTDINTKNVSITIYTPMLRKIENSGVADIRLDSLATDELKVENSGVGSLVLKQIKARRIDIKCSGVGGINIKGLTDEAEYSCSGVGSINAKAMKARKVKAKVSGIGNIGCYASDYINGRVTGIGELMFTGHPARKELIHSRVGAITEL